MTTPASLPVPGFYDPQNVGSWSYRPDVGRLFEEATAFRAQHNVRPSGSDRAKVHLLPIDVQKATARSWNGPASTSSACGHPIASWVTTVTR